jgi:glycosyltransferase involved in cell wall biosynthesis
MSITGNEPLVSILMTAYNREKYIAEAIESVLSSDYKNYELIITDDCSTDKTLEIANRYALSDSRIKVYANQNNLGDYHNRNKAASYATGKYLKYLDSDDTLYPWGLKAMVYCMEKQPAAAFGVLSTNADAHQPLPVLVQPHEAYRRFFFYNDLLAVGPTGVIIRTDAFKEAGGFSGRKYIGDMELWLRLAKKHPLVCMPNYLIWWRQHDGQQIKEEKFNPAFEADKFFIYKEALSAPDCPLSKEESKTALRNQYNMRGRIFIKNILQGNLKKAGALYKAWGLSIGKVLRSPFKNKIP